MTAVLRNPSHPAMDVPANLHLRLRTNGLGREVGGSPLPSPLVSPLSPPNIQDRKAFTASETPSTPKSRGANNLPPLQAKGPVADYSMLRQQHAVTLRYIISKLRWEQAHNGYHHREKAWVIHDRVIADMQAELKMVEAAQKAYDRWADFAYEPFAEPKAATYGPQTREVQAAAAEKALNDMIARNKRLDEAYPFIKQLYIGPMTKEDARNDAILRDRLEAHCFDEIDMLLPPANLQMLEQGDGRDKKPRKGYWDIRMEREKATIKRFHAEAVADEHEAKDGKEGKAARIGPLTKEEHLATLPVFGPKTRTEQLLVNQKEQRQLVLGYLRQPWNHYNPDAAKLLEDFGKFAIRELRKEAGGVKEGA